MRPRQRAQAVVEFGIIALTFTLLMFAVVDLGMLLNSWVRISAGVREVGRAASVGANKNDVPNMVKALVLPGISQNLGGTPFDQYCCGDPGLNAKIVVSITYYNQCIPGAVGCNQVPASQVSDVYWGGTCAGCAAHPARGDTIVVTLAAPGMEIITPLVRPFFGCSGSNLHCYVRLGSTAMMRYEGQ